MSEHEREDRTLEVAEQVAEVLAREGVQSAVIGALALAAHRYSRETKDLDLATDTDPFSQLRKVVTTLRDSGLQVEFETPDADDSLGGVVTITGDDFDDVQIVNFWNPLRPGGRNPGGDAVRLAVDGLVSGSSLRVVDLPHLISLKLYAGGPKSRTDVMELLTHNPAADRSAIRAVCAKFDLQADFDAISSPHSSSESPHKPDPAIL